MQWCSEILTSDLVKERQGPMSSLYMRLRKAEERSRLGFSFHIKNSANRTESICKKETIHHAHLLNCQSNVSTTCTYSPPPLITLLNY